MYVCVGVICAHACIEARKHLPLSLPTLFVWDKVCPWTLSKAKCQQAPPVSCLHSHPNVGVVCEPSHTHLSKRFWRWNSVPHACAVSSHTHEVISPTHGSSLCCWFSCTLMEHQSLVLSPNMYWISISIFNIRKIMKPRQSYSSCVVLWVKCDSLDLSFPPPCVPSAVLSCREAMKFFGTLSPKSTRHSLTYLGHGVFSHQETCK